MYPLDGVTVVRFVSSGRMLNCCESVDSGSPTECVRMERRFVDALTMFNAALTAELLTFVT